MQIICDALNVVWICSKSHKYSIIEMHSSNFDYVMKVYVERLEFSISAFLSGWINRPMSLWNYFILVRWFAEYNMNIDGGCICKSEIENARDRL